MYEKWKAEWKEEGIRQYEIAGAIGVAPSTLSRWIQKYGYESPSWLEEALQKAELKVREYHEEQRREHEERKKP